ncbi:hypothetical protein, partial [Runella sp. CRIBMP]|uniref:hypothetical protein n=1 Tax=Runella sp. CRIBMP TaxID=2683261 RepID=UPI001E46921D
MDFSVFFGEIFFLCKGVKLRLDRSSVDIFGQQKVYIVRRHACPFFEAVVGLIELHGGRERYQRFEIDVRKKGDVLHYPSHLV